MNRDRSKVTDVEGGSNREPGVSASASVPETPQQAKARYEIEHPMRFWFPDRYPRTQSTEGEYVEYRDYERTATALAAAQEQLANKESAERIAHERAEDDADNDWLDCIASHWNKLTGKPWDVRDGETRIEGIRNNVQHLFQHFESDLSAAQERIRQLEEGYQWSKCFPNKQALWWWWNGNEDSAPIAVHIMYSGTDGSYFATEGQYGWNRAQDVEEMGGMWQPAYEPPAPSTPSAAEREEEP